MTWFYKEKEFILPNPNPYEGFVYIIENKINDKLYIGKKNFWSRQKNKKTGRRETKESDWNKYYSSCEELQLDVEKYGKENFKRIILHLCFYKKQMTFLEEKEQWEREVLLKDNYYNTNIGGKFFVREKKIYWAVQKEITTKNDRWRELKRQRMTGDNNIAKKPEIRAKISEKKKGKNHHQYGKPISNEHNKKLHDAALKAVIKDWEITTPSGEVIHITNMNAFCKLNGLTPSAMTQVASGKRPHHKKYICKKL